MNDGFGRHGATARAAFFVEKIHDFAQRAGVRGIPKIGAFAADVDEANLLELFEMVGKGGGWNAELFLDFAGDQAGRVGGEKETENLETRLGTESREAVGGARDE